MVRTAICVFLVAVLATALGPANVVYAANPTLTGYDISPKSAKPGDTITFSYTISNPASSAQNIGLGASLRDPGGAWINDTTNDIVVNASPGSSTKTRSFKIPSMLTAGLYDVYWGLWSGTPGSSTQYQVVDRQDYLTISISDTTKPVVNSFSVSPSSVTLGGSFTISYSVSDAGGSGLKQVELWRAPDSGGSPGSWAQLQTKAASGNSASGSFTDAPPSVGAYWYGVHVVDNAGNWAPESSPAKVTVTQANRDPSLSRVSPSASSLTLSVGSSQSFTASASDPDGNLQSMVWYVNGGGQRNVNISGSSAQDTFNWTFSSTGSFTVEARAFDTQGGASPFVSWTVTVNPAADTTKPVVNSFSVSPSSVTLGGSFTISYSVSDAGGSGLKQVELWRAPDSGGSPGSWAQLQTKAASGNSASGSFTDAPPSVGAYWYGVHVVDNAGNWAPESSPAKVTVKHQLLQLVDSECSVNPSTANPGERVAISYRIYNPNASPVTIAIGASARPASGGSWINDADDDTTLSVPSGYSTRTRYFDVPSSASSGIYTVWYAIRDGSITGAAFDELQKNDLTIASREAALPPKPEAPRPIVSLILIFPTQADALKWDKEFIHFQGQSDAGAKVQVFWEGSEAGLTTVSSDQTWKIENIPIRVGTNKYLLSAAKEGYGSWTNSIEFHRASLIERRLAELGEVLEGTKEAGWRILIGEPQNIEEFAGTVVRDLVVVGDIVDAGKEVWFYIIDDPEFEPGVLGLSLVGIVSTVAPEADWVVSLLKQLSKYISKIRKVQKVASLADHLWKAGLRAAKDMDAGRLKSLINSALRLSNKELPEYLRKYGDEGKNLIERMAKRLDDTPQNLEFTNVKNLARHTDDHYEELAKTLNLPFDKAEFASNPQKYQALYLNAARDFISQADVKKVIYKYEGKEARIGYFLKKDDEIIFAARNEEGMIDTFFVVNPANRARYNYLDLDEKTFSMPLKIY